MIKNYMTVARKINHTTLLNSELEAMAESLDKERIAIERESCSVMVDFYRLRESVYGIVNLSLQKVQIEYTLCQFLLNLLSDSCKLCF